MSKLKLRKADPLVMLHIYEPALDSVTLEIVNVDIVIDSFD